MKTFILILALFSISIFYCQTTPNKKSNFDFEPSFKIQVFKPIQVGEYSLSSAHKSNIGFGFSFGFISYKNFSMNSGYDFVKYSVTDFTKVGNFDYTNYHSVYNDFLYTFHPYTNIGIAPNIGIGYAKLIQKTGSRDFGFQEGIEYRLGIQINYKIDKTISLFIGSKFIYSSFIINTAPELINFYGASKQFQINFGIQLD